MAFVQAMNSPNTKKTGVNGADVYTEDGVGSTLLTLFTMLNRGLETSYLSEHTQKIFHYHSPEEIKDLFVMAFQTRDIRGGKGEKKLFYEFVKILFSYDPLTTRNLLQLVPEYGCWNDMWEIITLEPSLEDTIFLLVKNTFEQDWENYCAEEYQKLSLLSKWLPREGSGRYPALPKKLAHLLYPSESSERKRMIFYRKSVSAMNKALNTVEINMCGKSWSSIIPENVPGRCLTLHTKAFLNEPTSSKSETTLRYPNNTDRLECREHFLEFIESMKSGTKKAHGANVVMPHELVAKMLGHLHRTTSNELEIYQGQWNSIREETLSLGGLGKCVPMCDFSGSMNGTPRLVSLALGILISEVNHSAFKDHIMTFDSTPSWHSFQNNNTLLQKLKTVGSIGQGLNTNFFKACMCIIDKMVEHKVPVGEEPEDLIVLTDMGFDSASSNNSSRWETQLTTIQREFKEAGEKLWGQGNGWKPPRIVIWNLRAEYKDFHATAHQEGVVQLSGWSPSILKALQKGGVQMSTPYQSMRTILDDERYDPVRSLLNTRYAL
jgi:hypothetical protein